MSYYNVAVAKNFSSGVFLAESPANPLRGVETTRTLAGAKRDFADQAAINAYLVARGGVADTYVLVDLGALGVT